MEVRLGGRLLAATDRAMKLDETGLPSRYYLPPDDVQMDLLTPTTFHTNCPFKGEASDRSLDIDGEIHDGIVWSYETPIPQAAEVRGDVVFLPRPRRGNSRRSVASRLTHPSISISGLVSLPTSRQLEGAEEPTLQAPGGPRPPPCRKHDGRLPLNAGTGTLGCEPEW